MAGGASHGCLYVHEASFGLPVSTKLALSSREQVAMSPCLHWYPILAEVHAVDENRTAPRRRLLKSGKISFGGSTIDCTVRNFSETGAALDVVSPIGIPEHFTLLIEADHVDFPCHVVWRKPSRIGVRFVSN